MGSVGQLCLQKADTDKGGQGLRVVAEEPGMPYWGVVPTGWDEIWQICSLMPSAGLGQRRTYLSVLRMFGQVLLAPPYLVKGDGRCVWIKRERQKLREQGGHFYQVPKWF